MDFQEFSILGGGFRNTPSFSHPWSMAKSLDSEQDQSPNIPLLKEFISLHRKHKNGSNYKKNCFI